MTATTAKTTSGKIRQLRHGLFSITEAARLLCVEPETFRGWLKDQRLPRPATLAPWGGRRAYYNLSDLAELRRLLEIADE